MRVLPIKILMPWIFNTFRCLAFVVLPLLGHYSVSGQNYADSLETRFLLVDNEEKIIILDKLIQYYFRNEPLLARDKAVKMRSLSMQVGDRVYEIKAQRYLGLSKAFVTFDYDKALVECYAIEEVTRTNGLAGELALTKLAIADIFRQTGNFTESLKYQAAALHIADSMDYRDMISEILNSEARNYIDLGDMVRAELALRQSLKNAQFNSLREQEAEAHALFGEMYFRGINQQMAITKFKEALRQYTVLHDKINIAESLYKIGDCYFFLNQPDSAFFYHKSALDIRSKIKDGTGQAESYNKIGLLCIESAEYPRAIRNLRLGLNYAEKVNSNLLMQQSFDYLTQAYLGNKDFKNALIYQQKNAEISELIYSEANEKKIQELTNKLEIEQREKEIKNLEELNTEKEKALANSRKFNVAFGFLIATLLLVTVLFILLYRNKRRSHKELELKNNQISLQNEKLTELNSTKDKFFSIIGHDLKGPLNSLSAFSHLLINHTASLTEEEIRTIARDLDKSLKNLYELLENLLGWARSQTGRLEMTPISIKVIEVFRENVRLLGKAALNKKIKVEIIADDKLEVIADLNSFKTVIRNLLSNAIKFTDVDGVITIFADEWKDTVEIGIHDTGVGMSPVVQAKIFEISSKHSTLGTNKEKGTGLGLILCKEFIEKNHGTIRVESEEGVGTTFRITLPKPLKESTLPETKTPADIVL